jgi:hypothetical protein
MTISLTDFDKMMEHPDYKGWGYLGHECRTIELDKIVVQEINALGLDVSEAFLFLNSRYARMMGDSLYSLELSVTDKQQIIRRNLADSISKLKEEIRGYN